MAATLSASQAIGEFLRSPDDLHKLASLRKKLTKESSSIQAKLSSGVKDQLDATRDGLRKLVAAKANLDAVEEEMRRVERIAGDPKGDVKAFRKISRVSLIHRNFSRTEEMVKSFQEISSKVDLCADLLEDDIAAGILAPQDHLLACHYQLMELESFRNETLHQAKKSTREELETVRSYFERLDSVVVAFDARLWELASRMLDLVRADRMDTVVKILKIVEVESREDEKAAAMKLIKRSKGDAASKFKSIHADARKLKHYRQKLMKTLADSIRETFASSFEEHLEHPMQFLEDLGWLYKDLIRIESDVVPCFPPDYNIHTFLVKTYHKTLDDNLQKILGSAPEASVLLTLHGWIKEYKASMKELEIPSEWLDPPLLDGREQDLIEDYVGLIVKKMDEWTRNLQKDEEREFCTRDQPVELEEGGLYGMQGAVILFQMVNQQVDAAADSGQGGVLARVVTEAGRVMRAIQARWVALLEQEVKRHVERPEEAPSGLAEYVTALANDQIKSADYAEALSARLEPLVSEKYRVVIAAQVNEAIDGYLDVAKACTQTLVDLAFNDLKLVTKAFFTPAWYADPQQPTAVVIETLRDYLSDYQEHLHPTLFDLVLEDMIDTFLVVYLSALRGCSKLKMASVVPRIRNDIDSVYSLFADFKPKDALELNFEVVQMILAMLEASKEMVFLDFWTFAKIHGPNFAFIEGILRARDNLDRTSVNEIMETARRRVREDPSQMPDPSERTIMTKLANVKGEGLFSSFNLASLASRV